MSQCLLTRTNLGLRTILNRINITELNGVKARCSSNQATANRFILSQSSFKNEGSWFKKLQYKTGMGDVNLFALRRASVFHYQACTDALDTESFFKNLQLPDTLFGFFLVVQLHVWMCQVRSMSEGPEGRRLRNEIIERMWQDIDTRLQKMEVWVFNQRKQILTDLLFHHQAAIFSYDEGLLTDDKTLANALWRTLFSKSVVQPEVLEMSVRYVRTQMDHLRSIGPRDWCLDGRFEWAPFAPLNNNLQLRVTRQ